MCIYIYDMSIHISMDRRQTHRHTLSRTRSFSRTPSRTHTLSTSLHICAYCAIHTWLSSHERHVSSACATWLISMCNTTHSWATWLIRERDMTHSHTWRDSYVARLICICDMTLFVCMIDSIICATCLIRKQQKYIVCATWLIRMCDMTDSCVRQ